MSKKLGQEPAYGYPAHTDLKDEPGNGRRCNSHDEQPGMSKRFYAACAAMQGILASWDRTAMLEGKGIELAVKVSYECADELLEQEFKEDI